MLLTDSLSALQALMFGEPDTTQKKLTENISTLVQTTCVVLQWIPAQAGIRGNDIADQFAKEGREKEQPPSHLSCREIKTLIRNKKKAIFHCKTGGYKPIQDALHQLPRHQQITINTRHQNITYSPAYSTSKQGSRYGPLVCPSKPSSGSLQRICS